MRHYQFWVYIMASDKGNLYIGVTNNLTRRIFEHTHNLIAGYTRDKQCHKLVYFEESNQIEDALKREKQLKGWSRMKKRALIARINPGWRDLGLDFLLKAIQ